MSIYFVLQNHIYANCVMFKTIGTVKQDKWFSLVYNYNGSIDKIVKKNVFVFYNQIYNFFVYTPNMTLQDFKKVL